ncbi:FCPF [Symbiodinium sp. CCMP2456]|nr:FCPF [Symbiodinium sp. CCMP2456]
MGVKNVAKSCASQVWRWQEEERVKKAQQQEVTALPDVVQVLEISLEAQRKFNQEQAGRQRKRAEARLTAQLEEDMAKQAAEAKLQQEEAEERKKRKQQEVAKQMAEAAKQAVEQKAKQNPRAAEIWLWVLRAPTCTQPLLESLEALQKQEEAKKAPEPPQPPDWGIWDMGVRGTPGTGGVGKRALEVHVPACGGSQAPELRIIPDEKMGGGLFGSRTDGWDGDLERYPGEKRRLGRGMWLTPSSGAEAIQKIKDKQAAGKTKKLPKREKGRKKKPFEPSEQLGVTEPLGFWDPIGISPKDEQTFYEYRVCEIKHGRVAMMACIGAIGQHYLRFGWFSKTTWGEPMPSGFAAVFSNPAAFGMIVLTAVAGLLEFTLFKDDISKGAGNFGDPLRIGQYTDDMRNRELNNGRFAMFSIMGIIAAEGATGKDAIEQLGL